MAILTVPSATELETLALAYDLGPLRDSRGIEAGTVNTSYSLDLGVGRFFLRIYEEQADDGARREAALLNHLAEAGVPTPRPVAARDGALVRAISGKPCALFPWIDGGMLCQRAVTPAAAEKVGAALAQVHLAGAPPSGEGLAGGRFGPQALVARCGRVASSSDPAARPLADSLRAAVESVAQRRDTSLPSGLVHGDLFRDNVLWDTRGNIAALLDFESACHGPFAYDLAVTVLSWAYSTAIVPDVARAIADGYRRVRELEEREREAIHDEAILATLRFTITRITDEAIRVGKKWQRFVERRGALERIGRRGLREVLGL